MSNNTCQNALENRHYPLTFPTNKTSISSIKKIVNGEKKPVLNFICPSKFKSNCCYLCNRIYLLTFLLRFNNEFRRYEA